MDQRGSVPSGAFRGFAHLCGIVALFATLTWIHPSALGQGAPLLTNITSPLINSQGPPRALATGDFNGDGIPDAAMVTAVGSAQSYNLLIYLGNGDGTFQFPATYTLGNTYVGSMYSGDLNGDGKVDLVMTSWNGATGAILVMLGNGDGTLQSPISTALGTGEIPNYMVVGDFNSDGKLDLVAAISPPTATIEYLQGNGDGTFAAPAAIAAGTFANQSVAVADFNGDGHLDLAFVNSTVLSPQISTISVALGDGKGGFSVQPESYQFDHAFDFVKIGDFNGDGIPDLLELDGPELTVLTGNGDGTFNQESPQVTGLGGFVAIADFNQDGNLDLFVSGSSFNFGDNLLLGNGDGTFQAPSALDDAFGIAANGYSSSLALAMDLNNDGRPDVLSAINTNIDDNGTAVPGITQLGAHLNTPGTNGVTLSPAAYDFGNQAAGLASNSTTIILGNSGTTVTQFTNPQLDNTTDFSFTSTCGTTLAVADSCTVTVAFAPQATGVKSARLTFTTDDPLAGAHVIQLRGTGIAPALSASPAALAFSYQKVGTTSTAQTFQVTNSGYGPLLFTSIAAQGDFQETNNCPASLAAGASCTVSVVYAPLVTGSEVGRVTFTTNAVVAQSAVPLSGIGYVTGPIVAVAPASLNFGSQYVGTSSAPGVVTVQNNGDAPFTISSVAATSGFVPLSTCGNQVQPSFSCAIGVFFDPAATGDQTGTLTIVDNLASSPQSVPLSGTGTAITVGPSSGASTSLIVTSGQTAAYNMSLSPVSGYQGTVSLSCTGLPAQFTCSLESSSVTLNGSDSASVKVSVSSTTAMVSDPIFRQGSPGSPLLFAGCFAGLSFLGAGFRRGDRRRLLMLALIAFAAVCVISCGGGTGTTSSKPTAQTYVFLLQSQPASGVTIDTPLTLTVQQ